MGENRWVRRWPWLLIAAGAGLGVRYAWAGREVSSRETYFLAMRERPHRWVGEVHHLAKRVDGLRGGAAERIAFEAFDQAKNPLEREAAHILLTRVRVQNGAAAEDDLASFLDPDADEILWSFALQQLFNLRKARGDAAGAVALMEDVFAGRLRHPEHDRVPFQYIERAAAWTLAEHFLSAGDGPSARQWALRIKYDIAAHVDYPCGNGYRMEHDATEEILFKAAALSGRTYVKEPINWAQRSRRDFGPPFLECAGGALLGCLLAFVGICVLTRRAGRWPGRAVSLRLLWSPRGALAQLAWTVWLVVGALAQLGLAFLALKDAPAVDGGSLLGLLICSPLFIVPMIGLTGCYRAVPAGGATSAAAPRARSRTRRGGGASARRPIWVKGPFKRAAGWILPEAPRRPAR